MVANMLNDLQHAVNKAVRADAAVTPAEVEEEEAMVES